MSRIGAAFLVLTALITNAVSTPNNCCSPGGFIDKKLCNDGNKITLNCTKRFLLDNDIEDESFSVNLLGQLIYKTPLETNAIVIAKENYCVANIGSGNGSQVAVICFDSLDNSIQGDTWYELRAACGFISVFFILATLIVYCLVPTLRDLQGKCIMHSLTALGISLFNLGIIQLFALDDHTCVFYSFLNYFTFMTTFFWLNVTSFHVWKTIVYPQKMENKQNAYLFYLLYGYGMPVAFVIILLISHNVPGDHMKPKMGEVTCWFGGVKETFAYFYGPISVLLVLNVTMFIWSTSVLTRENNKLNEPKLKSLKYKLSLYCKLFLIMGLTWVFEVLSAATADVNIILTYLWVITDYINVLQGVLIFILLVVLRKRALRGLAERGFCGFRFPSSWKALEDQETEGAEAEVRLSHSEYA